MPRTQGAKTQKKVLPVGYYLIDWQDGTFGLVQLVDGEYTVMLKRDGSLVKSTKTGCYTIAETLSELA